MYRNGQKQNAYGILKRIVRCMAENDPKERKFFHIKNSHQ